MDHNTFIRFGGRTFWEVVRFGLVGLTGTGFYVMTTLILERYARQSAPLSASIAFVLVVAGNYCVHRTWTFRSKRRHLQAAPRFLATSFGGLALNGLTLTILDRWTTFSEGVTLVAGISVVVMWNYLLNRVWVFAKER
jgi:putative flippase GtrA